MIVYESFWVSRLWCLFKYTLDIRLNILFKIDTFSFGKKLYNVITYEIAYHIKVYFL